MKRNYKVITGEAIKKARASLNETQTQFADRVGTDQGTISRWEAGLVPQSGMTQSLLRRVLDEIDRVVRQ